MALGVGCDQPSGAAATSGGGRSPAEVPSAAPAGAPARPDRELRAAGHDAGSSELPAARGEQAIAWPLAALTWRGELAGDSFDATDARGRTWVLVLASTTQPRPDRRPRAYLRVARALGLTTVAECSLTRLPVGRLGELLENQPAALEQVKRRATIGNDGTIMALAYQTCSGRSLDVASNEQVARWRELARGASPLTAADEPLVRGYVEMAVLDYLTGNIEGRSLWLSSDGARTCLGPQAGAFPGFLPPAAGQELLGRVRPIAHFPPRLEQALVRLDRSIAQELLLGGPFAQWLIGPRDLGDLLERRDTLLSLLQALRDRRPGPDASATVE